MQEAQWFYVTDGARHGPVADVALREMVAAGALRPTDLVWSAGMENWEAAGRVPGLFPPGISVPPPLPVNYIFPSPARPIGEDAGMRMLLPVGRSGWAIAAGYLGLFAVLMVPAPLALICSIVAIRDIRKHPSRHGMGRAVFGLIMGAVFTLALLGIVVLGLINIAR